jgi:phospholipid/cholesterol/gamma-HCH transport system substrate-binding protein
MKDSLKSAKVGLAVVLGVALVAWVYRYIDSGGRGEAGYTVYALFDDAQGLIVKSRVVIAGIPIGTIRSIGLDGEKARVDIDIDKGVVLYEDATVRVRAVSLLGEKILSIWPGTPGRDTLVDGDRIRVVVESLGTDDVVNTVGRVAEDIKSVTTQLKRAFGNDVAGDQMASALKDLSEALAAVNRTIQANEELVSRTIENIAETTELGGPKLVRILENIEAVTADVRDILGEHKDELGSGIGEVDDTIASIHRAAQQLEAVLADVKTVTGRTAEGSGTLGRLTQDEALVDEIEGIAEGLNDIVGIWGRLRTIAELRSEYNLLSNTFKTYFSLRLQTRESRYYLVQLVDDPRGDLRVTQSYVRRSPAIPGEPGEYQETRITRSDRLRFTIMMGKTVGPATFRFGILESKGGLGLDLHGLDDRLELATDIWAFGEQIYPRLRSRLAFEFVKHLYVVAGIDDVMNPSRDVFLGLQLRFDDEDLKGILPFAGGLAPR